MDPKMEKKIRKVIDKYPKLTDSGIAKKFSFPKENVKTVRAK